MRKRLSWRLPVGLVFLAVLVASVTAYVEQQQLFDWWRLRQYQAPATVQSLARDATMNNVARTIFYVNHPKVEDKSQFNGECPSGGEQTIVLGCYHSNQQGIVVLKVADSRLNGVEQVTAAHEMLHAAYDRLSANEKKYVDDLLKNYYKHDLHDQRILDTINAYKKSEPDQLVNEMHSIFGTEIAKLPAPLEAYYKRYFTNRLKVVAYAAKYQEAFTSRKAVIKKYDVQLGALKKDITNDEATLDAQSKVINTERQQLEAYRNAGNYSAFNAGVASYNTRVDAYNLLTATTRSLIAQYNDIVQQRNAIAAEEGQLVQAIDGTVQPIKQ